MASKGYIYGLRSPDNEIIMYVGKTHHPEKRLVEHVAAARDGVLRPVYVWIRELMNRDQSPIMVILEEIEAGSSARREAAWIKHFKSLNPKLTNAPHGRLGGRRLVNQVTVLKWEPDRPHPTVSQLS